MVSIVRGLSIASLGLFSLATSISAQQHYKQTNLVSNISGMATVTDPNLVNPWGLSRSSGSPWWVSDNGVGLTTLYGGTGAPPPPGPPCPAGTFTHLGMVPPGGPKRRPTGNPPR